MAIITFDTLKALCPPIPQSRLAIMTERLTTYAQALDQVMAAAQLTTPLRLAHFMAQLAYESDGFKALVENLDYKPETLLRVFPSHVKSLADANAIVAGGPSAIAEAIYGNRKDLGNVNPGDGYRFIGRGFIMITGRANYTHYGALIVQPLADQPQLLEQAIFAAQTAAAYWVERKINAKADIDDISAVTKLVNGGLNGLDGRKALLQTAKGLWPTAAAAAIAAAVSAATPIVSPPPAPQPAPPASTASATPFSSRHFALAELTFSDTATRMNIDNTPSAAVVTALGDTARRMDLIRDLLAQPVNVVSGYRSPALNSAIHGSPHSAHMTGHAVDFVCRAFGTPLQICQKIVTSGVKFDQLIQEGTWVHISFDPQMRNQVLTADFSGGAASYKSGL